MRSSTSPSWSAPARGRCGEHVGSRTVDRVRIVRAAVLRTSPTRRDLPTAYSSEQVVPSRGGIVRLHAVAAGAGGHHGIIRPGTQGDRQEDDGVDHEPEAGPAEGGEEGQEHDGQHRGDVGQHPGHAPVAGQLLLDRLDAQPEPAELATPVLLPAAPGRVEVLAVGRCRDIHFHGFYRNGEGPAGTVARLAVGSGRAPPGGMIRTTIWRAGIGSIYNVDRDRIPAIDVDCMPVRPRGRGFRRCSRGWWPSMRARISS